MRSLPSTKSQSGISLVEIMIALALGAFLTAGIIQIFLASKQTYRIQDGLSAIQENGRFSMDFITRDIRMADFWVCINVANVESKLNANAVFDAFAFGITGQDNDNGGNIGGANNDGNNNGIWDGTDSVTLRGVIASNVFLVLQPATTAAVLRITNNSGLAAGDIVLLSDCSSGDIFQITNLNPAPPNFDNLIHNAGNLNATQRLEVGLQVNNPIPPNTPQDNLYRPGAQISPLAFIQYSIRQGQNGRASLFRSINQNAPQELVQGVEDMQILYGEDTDLVPDSTANNYVNAAAVVDWNRVVSVRLALLLHSPNDNLTSQPLQFIFNGAPPILAADRRLRREYTTTIALRNRQP